MKTIMKTILCITLLAFTLSCEKAEQQPKTTALQTDKEKISYAIGVNMAQSISEIKDEIDLSMLQKGMTDKMQGNILLVSTEEAQPLLQSFSEKIMAREQEKSQRPHRKIWRQERPFLKVTGQRKVLKQLKAACNSRCLKMGKENLQKYLIESGFIMREQSLTGQCLTAHINGENQPPSRLIR